MKIRTLIGLIALPMMCISCLTTRIVTVSPVETGVAHYSTTVTVPRSHTVTTTTVYSQNYDYCLQLDLQAVGAAFAQSSSVREFEILLNNSSYMISNLDLNRDGYVDYLRVVEERVDWDTDLFVIQAVLGYNIFQDVATIVVEHPSYTSNYYVEIIGDPYIYGHNYIVCPTYHARPRIFGHLCSRNYSVWVTPYGWNNYPSSYKRPAPVYPNHYHAYVNTYMSNHHYCHAATYPSSVHYSNYGHRTQSIRRNDYSTSHPDEDFSVRNANVPVSNSAVDRAENARRRANASDVYKAQQRNTETAVTNSRNKGTSSTTTTATSGSRGNSSTTTSNTSSSRGGNTTPTGSTTSSRNNGTSSTATSTTSSSRGNSTSTTTTSSSSSRGNNTTSSSATSSSRGNSTSTTTTSSSSSRGNNTSSSSATSNSRGNSSTSSASRSNSSTTVKSSVRSSGSSETTVKTVSPNGSETTVKRNSSSSSRSSSASSSTKSSSTSSSTTSSRSEAGSSRSGSTSSRGGNTTSSTSTSRRN